MQKIIIGFAGELACGKGTATKYIVEKYHGEAFRFSSMLRDVLDRLYLEQTRENLQILSTALRQNFSEDLFAKVMREDANASQAAIVVIDGVRRLADIEYLKKLPGFNFVYIETDVQKCYDRIIKRGENKDDNQKTFEQFKKDHEPEAEQQIKALKNHADFVIDNNGTFENLYAQIDKIIKEAK